MLLSFQTCVAATLSLLLVAAPQTAAADLHTRLPTQGAADVNLLIESKTHAGQQYPDRQLVEADQQPRYTASGASHPVVVASPATGAANSADTISREQPSVDRIGKTDTGSNPGAEAQPVPISGIHTDHVAAASRTISGAQGSTASDRLGAARASSDTTALDQILRTADQEVPEENSIADVLLDEQGPTDRVWRQRRISLDEAYVRLNATASEDPALQIPLSDHAQLAIGRHRACSAFYLKGRPPVQRVALVGNGPLTDQQRAEIDTLDLVIRFNKMNNRFCGERVDVWLLRHAGDDAALGWHGMGELAHCSTDEADMGDCGDVPDPKVLQIPAMYGMKLDFKLQNGFKPPI